MSATSNIKNGCPHKGAETIAAKQARLVRNSGPSSHVRNRYSRLNRTYNFGPGAKPGKKKKDAPAVVKAGRVVAGENQPMALTPAPARKRRGRALTAMAAMLGVGAGVFGMDHFKDEN